MKWPEATLTFINKLTTPPSPKPPG